ncbi:MAG: zinc ribbon domain-containing protein [Aeriscardovia sp.]|nr:zinc ribbon domain-containing protein [Aeriscardovia sp.]
MPTYHYRCKNCGYDFFKEQAFNDPPITVCPKCGKKQVHKVYSVAGIQFKGNGFYRTDSGSVSKAASKSKTKSN